LGGAQNDKIDLSHFSFSLNAAELQTLIDASTGDTINFGDGFSTLTLTGVNLNQLSVANDFILPP